VNNIKLLSTAQKLTVAGLLVAATGISTLFLTNSVTVPAIAVGPILLVLGGGLVAFGPWRWTPAVGIALGLFILAGAFIAPGLFDRLGNPAQTGGFVGTWVQILGLLTAVGAGTAALMQNYRTAQGSTRTNTIG
jgi:hypothetical protein